MKILFAGLWVLLLALTGCAPNSAKNDKDMAFITGDYKTALVQYQTQAAQGDAAAERMLGVMYTNGTGVPKDPVEGLRWYEKAANDGDSIAIGYMAGYYMVPHGGPMDYAQAFRWYKALGDMDQDAAALQLSILYENGLGVQRDHDQALSWLNKFISYEYKMNGPAPYPHRGDDNLINYRIAMEDAVGMSGFHLQPHSGAGGIAYLDFNIRDGRAVNIVVGKSSGDPVDDAAAVDALQRAYLPPLLPSLQGLDHLEMGFNFGQQSRH